MQAADEGPFIRGPLCWAYWSAVARLGVNPLRLAMGIRYLAGFRRGRGAIGGVRIGLGDVRPLGLDHRAARRALAALEDTGLAVVARGAGRKPVIKLLDHRVPGERALHIRIPWAWWHAASPLPGSAVRIALALWFECGWLGGKAEFPFSLSDLESIGCTRWAAGRGLDALAGARLISVEHRPGRLSIVTVNYQDTSDE